MNKYQCTHCEYKTLNKTVFRNHVNAIHLGIEYHCDQCDFKSKWKTTVSVHKRAVHEQSSVKYPCEFCDLISTTSSAKLRHTKLCHGIAEFRCDKCEFVSKQKGHWGIYLLAQRPFSTNR